MLTTSWLTKYTQSLYSSNFRAYWQSNALEEHQFGSISVWAAAAATAAKLLQSCPTLCDSIDGSPPGSTLRGILQATTLEWIAISFSNAWKWKVKVKSLSRARLLATPWTAAQQAPPSHGIFQARVLEWVAIAFFKKVKVKSLHHARLFATPWAIAHQAPLSMGFSRQEYWSGLPVSSPGSVWALYYKSVGNGESRGNKEHLPFSSHLVCTKQCL